MINFFVWKRKTTFSVRSLLILACCLMVMLGGMLITNESHAQVPVPSQVPVPCEITVSPEPQSPYSEVVVQNLRGDGLTIRKKPKKAGEELKGDNGETVYVYDDYTGVVQRDPKWHNKYFEIEIDEMDPEKLRVKYVWYHVRWNSGKEGWSAGIIDGKKYIDTILEAKQKDAIAQALFRDESPNMTFHDYNDYKCNARLKRDGRLVYKGKGHAGWDVQSVNQSSDRFFYPLTDRFFYPLTGGELIIPKDCDNTIAVYDPLWEKTTLYLHASDVLAKPDPNGMVQKEKPLGIEGDTGCFTNPVHVHIEVQKGRSSAPFPSKKAESTINPIPYLYRWVFPWDVDQDGQVNSSDLWGVFLNLGTDKREYDVNRDGIVNWTDLSEVMNHRTAWLAPAVHVSPAPLVDQTSLLPNYPNPFNPETWIPYSLAEDANVNLTIYNVKGTMVRHFDLGQQPAGHYIDRSKSIYWDGRNVLGEQVGSGVYLYHLQAGNYSATRRMVILK